MSYQELRSIAVRMNKEEGPRHPCSKGKGECCEPNILLSKGDADLIKEAVKRKKIPLQIINDASARLADESRERCVFLNEQNECSIYEQRPIICIVTGAGAAPARTNDKIAERAILSYQQTGIDSGVPMNAVGDPGCNSCVSQMITSGYKYSVKSVISLHGIMSELYGGSVTEIRTLVHELKRRDSRT